MTALLVKNALGDIRILINDLKEPGEFQAGSNTNYIRA